MTKQLKKYMAVTTASFMVMQLAACGSATEEGVEDVNSMLSNEENTSADLEIEEVYEVPDDMTPEEYANAVMSEQLVDISDSDLANACGEWVEDEDGSYECLDEDSPYYTQHFFNGLMFATAGAMIGSTMYKSYNRKNGTEKQRIINNAIVSPNNTRNKEHETNGSSGGGGGFYTSGSKATTNSNAINEANTTNSSNINSSTNTNGTTSNSSNSYSSSSNSNSSNTYSNNPSSSSGKSGFGSGGGSRGGSSSS